MEGRGGKQDMSVSSQPPDQYFAGRGATDIVLSHNMHLLGWK